MMSRLKTCYQKRLALKISHIIKLVPVLWLAGCALTPVPPATGNWSVEQTPLRLGTKAKLN